MNKNKTFHLVMILIFAFSMLGTPSPVLAQEHSPSIQVWVSGRVDGLNWPENNQISLHIENPSSPGSPTFDTTTPTFPCWWDGNQGCVNIDMAGFPFAIGQVMTMSDLNNNVREYIITSLNLKITGIDAGTDTVSGMADPNSSLSVNIGNILGAPSRYVTADSTGHWEAYFSDVGTGEPTFDIAPGTGIWVSQPDNDGDSISDYANVSNFPNPTFSVVPNDPNSGPRNIILGWDFEVGTTVNLCIDNPPFDSECDYADLLTVPSESSGFAGYQFQFSVDPSKFQITSGQHVQLDNDLHTEEHIVTNMRLVSVNWDTEQVSGTAEPGSKIEVPAAGGGFYVIRRVTANDNGEWTADFAQPGSAQDEQEILDLRLGQVFFIPEQWDENGNSTKFWWQPPNPIISTRPFERQISGYDWPDGALITMTIDDPDIPGSQNYSATATATMQDFGQTEAMFNLSGLFTLKAGDIVTMTDESTTKTHIVTNLAIQSVDVDTDQVFGVTDPGDTISIFVWDSQDNATAWRDVTADGSGNWVADFSVPVDEMTYDLVAGTWGETQEFDDDRDNTNVYWRVPNPAFSVLPDEDSMEGNDWPLDSTLTIKIGDPVTPDYSISTSVNPPDQDHNQTWFKLDLADDFNLQPGQIVTVSDTKTTKQTIIVPRNITLLDLVTDTIAGEAEPNIVNVVLWTSCVDNDCAVRIKDVNTDGSWFVSFGVPGEQPWEDDIVDIQPETIGGIYQGDSDGDGTTYLEWSVLNQPPTADAGLDQVVFAGGLVTLDASASSDPEAGALTYAWDLDNDSQYDDASGVTATTSFIQPGDHEIGLQVTDDGGLSDTDTVEVTVLAWTLKGFYQPVDMNGIYNIVKNGSTVPLKFEIFAGSTELTDITYVKSLTYALTTCNAGAVTDEIELTATGGTSLRYADGQFIYNWKTPNTAGKCYRVTMTTIDGSSLVAYFRLK